jgi:uncharacterized protein
MVESRVSVVGSGVAGLTAAYVLSRRHHVTLYEVDTRPGGHANTHQVGTLALDSGFMVFNEMNYLNLTRLFAELGVRSQPADMSFAVACDGCGLRYLAGSGLRGLPTSVTGATRELWSRTRVEVDRFNTEADTWLASGDDELGLGAFLTKSGFSEYFTAHVAAPLVAAVWSCGPGVALDYPARYLFRFLANHGLLRSTIATRWRTVVGGCQEYVRRVVERLPVVRTGTPVRAVVRTADGVEIHDDRGGGERFAAAVLAVHPDQALRLLGDATGAERAVLGAIPYAVNDTVLHTDSSLLPSAPGAWNYRTDSCDPSAAGAVMSYSLNRIQRVPGPVDYVVTLNATHRIRQDAMLARLAYAHPVYTVDSVAARQRLPALSGGRIAFAGAYHGWGFHEDGCRSGVLAAAALGVRW